MKTRAGFKTRRKVSLISSQAIIVRMPKNTAAPSKDEGSGPTSKTGTFVEIRECVAVISVGHRRHLNRIEHEGMGRCLTSFVCLSHPGGKMESRRE